MGKRELKQHATKELYRPLGILVVQSSGLMLRLQNRVSQVGRVAASLYGARSFVSDLGGGETEYQGLGWESLNN